MAVESSSFRIMTYMIVAPLGARLAQCRRRVCDHVVGEVASPTVGARGTVRRRVVGRVVGVGVEVVIEPLMGTSLRKVNGTAQPRGKMRTRSMW